MGRSKSSMVATERNTLVMGAQKWIENGPTTIWNQVDSKRIIKSKIMFRKLKTIVIVVKKLRPIIDVTWQAFNRAGCTWVRNRLVNHRRRGRRLLQRPLRQWNDDESTKHEVRINLASLHPTNSPIYFSLCTWTTGPPMAKLPRPARSMAAFKGVYLHKW